MPTVLEKEIRRAGISGKRVIQNPDVKLVNKSLDSYIENNTPIGYLHRISYDKNVHSLQQKAVFIHKGIVNAKLQGFFPYDRIIKNGSRQNGVIQEKGSADKSNCLIWTNNLYLGLNQHPRVIKAAQEATKIYGTGSGTSALSGGFCELHAGLINTICELTNKEDAILFSTGFTANQGFIGSIASPGDLILFDRDCHASLIDGINISGANSLSFKHNNASDLELKLEKNIGKYENVFVIIESVYSMSGDEAPLKAISALKKHLPFFFICGRSSLLWVLSRECNGVLCSGRMSGSS
ncbi:MAG: aminotransferase class I/II-fold pyridoxal phosphate-dependent enzyme [Candidatus Margulisiibacteriota bacterium]